MCPRALQSRLLFTFPSDEQIDQEFHPSKEALHATIGDFPNPTIFSDDHPPMFTRDETPKPPSDEEHSDDKMFDDDNTYVGAIPILTSSKTFQKPSSSKPSYYFGLFSSSEESKEYEEVNVDANTQGNEDQANPNDNPKYSEP